jgi:hypothetical protein
MWEFVHVLYLIGWGNRRPSTVCSLTSSPLTLQISIRSKEETRQQNEDMHRISACVALVAADTVVTGIYGHEL